LLLVDTTRVRPGAVISIHEEYARRIARGVKTVELRRVPARALCGRWAAVYVTRPVCAVDFVVRVEGMVRASPARLWRMFGGGGVEGPLGVSRTQFRAYFRGRSVAYGLVLGEVRVLDRAVTLEALRAATGGVFHPPQGVWCLDSRRTVDARVIAAVLPATRRMGQAA
jgi:predicted transcriptional regulator